MIKQLDILRRKISLLYLFFKFKLLLFTNYISLRKDLWSSQNGTVEYKSSLQGITYLNSVCTNGRYALVEDLGVFTNILQTSHDIGHMYVDSNE